MATILALSIVGPGALAVAGDDGPPHAVRPDRPTRTILRPTEIPDLDPAFVARSSDRPVCVLVSGIGSDAPDATFDRLVAALESQCEVHRFGGDPRYPYDTHGAIGSNADHLIAEVKELAKTHPEIKIVAHSMGGPVVDDAFRRGLSAGDKVTTYVALAAPHNGSTEAKAILPRLEQASVLGVIPEFRAITAGVGQDAGTPAVRDLAAIRAGPPPAGVRRVDLRVATDPIVTAPDAWTPGVESRTLLPSSLRYLEGHGGIMADPQAIALVTAAVGGGLPTLDWRGRILQFAAGQVSAKIAEIAPSVYAAIASLCLVGACVWALRRRRRTLLAGLVA